MSSKVIETVIQIKRGTTAEWEAIKNTFRPAEGEPCLDLTTGLVKYGDGSHTYGELPVSGKQASHYEGIKSEGENDNDVISRVLTALGVTASKDDVFVVKTLISEGKYSYTAFVYNGEAWAAMDGNYNAGNVYFDRDLETTFAIGTVVLTNGMGTVKAKGKNLAETWDAIFLQEKNPKIGQPSVTISKPAAKAYEVGTEVTPEYEATFNKGSYEFNNNKDTGLVVSSWEISDTNGNTAATASGTFPKFQIIDGTSYTVTAKANYEDGDIPLTNRGNEYAAGQIKKGNKSKTSGAITGYRNSFYGIVTDKALAIDSTLIRSLTASGAALANGSTFDLSVPIGATRVIIAYPATLRDLTSVLDRNDSSSNIVSSFGTPATVKVKGNNGYNEIDYKVYKLDFAKANDTANTYAVTI